MELRGFQNNLWSAHELGHRLITYIIALACKLYQIVAKANNFH